MDKHLEDCIKNKVPSKYIFPFYWQHEEDINVVIEGIKAIYDSGIREFCVESRVYEDFCKDKWWKDFGAILKTAEEKGMRVWLLDDKKFPSGYANGWIETHPELRKKSIRLEYLDVSGPASDNAVLANRLRDEEEYISISAWKKEDDGKSFTGEYIDLTDKYINDFLYFSVPAGIWRIFFVIQSYETVEDRKFYIDMLSKKSCQAVIDSVYEPHYTHFKKYFGNTFAGFFFDEPSFTNDSQTYRSKLGKPNMIIPWNNCLINALEETFGTDEKTILCYLPTLWQKVSKKSAAFRIAYMDAVSKAASANYSQMIGDWCREHNVMSVGHLIEDMDAHMRLGYGLGHYFRGLEGQDMGGMDIVLGQINPKITQCCYHAPVIEDIIDPAFYSYTLPHMAVSHASLDRKKNGRTMCEIFGAYGWVEGVPMMKQIVDSVLVNGVNYFVPHAFSNKYPDTDCPPHFWAGGNNFQYGVSKLLFDYIKRCSHLISDGYREVKVGVLYLPDGDWSGGQYLPLEKISKQLVKNQIDFDIVSEDYFEDAILEKDRINIKGRRYSVILVPFCSEINTKIKRKITELQGNANNIIVVYPNEQDNDDKVTLNNLVKTLYRYYVEPIIDGNQKDRNICIYRYERDGNKIYFIFNEDAYEEWEGLLNIGYTESIYYDAWENVIYNTLWNDGKLKIHLYPKELKIIISKENITREIETNNLRPYQFDQMQRKLMLPEKYDIYIKNSKGKTLLEENSKLINISSPKCLPDYSGCIIYDMDFCIEQSSHYYWLDLGKVGETADVWINDIYCGNRVVYPYCYYIKNIINDGINKIHIEVYNNMAYKEKDSLSQYFQLPPSGVLGPVSLAGI